MKIYRVRIFFVFAIVWLCVGSLPAEIIVPEGVEITETNLWTPFVDTLRIRETPDLNGKVIATIKLGEQVEYAGETSTNTSTVDFNGEKITDSWIKVKMKDGRIGWGWKGFMVGLKKYFDPKSRISFLIPQIDKVIDINIKWDKNIEGAPRMVSSLLNSKINISGKESCNTYFSWPRDMIVDCLFLEFNFMDNNDNDFNISVIIRDSFDYPKLPCKYFMYGGIEKKEFEEEVLPRVNAISDFLKTISNFKLSKVDNDIIYQSSGYDQSFWKYLYSKGYIPRKVRYPTWINREVKDTARLFINDVKKGNGSYVLTQWYNGAEIIFNSMEKE